MSIELLDIFKIILAFGLSYLIGTEREREDKPVGLRSIIFVCLGATLITIFSLKYTALASDFDMIRGIAYYLVAIGFVGGALRTRGKRIEGVTTITSLLPITILGFFIGIGEYILSVIITGLIYVTYEIKYIKIRMVKRRGKKT